VAPNVRHERQPKAVRSMEGLGVAQCTLTTTGDSRDSLYALTLPPLEWMQVCPQTRLAHTRDCVKRLVRANEEAARSERLATSRRAGSPRERTEPNLVEHKVRCADRRRTGSQSERRRAAARLHSGGARSERGPATTSTAQLAGGA
jgi:hypothetical protein